MTKRHVIRGGVQKLLAGYREKLQEAAALGVPLGVIAAVDEWAVRHLLAAPWKVIWVVLPLAGIAFVAWRLIQRQGFAKFDWRLITFCSAYSAIFVLASTFELNAWKRVPEPSRDVIHYRWASFLPVAWGDWRYRLATSRPESDEVPIALVLLEELPDTSKSQIRLRDLRLVQAANQGNAKGLGLDFEYIRESGIDKLFCENIRAFTKPKDERPRALVTAYEMRKVARNLYERIPAIDQQPECLSREQQGHAAGFADADGLVRGIPLFWQTPQFEHPALSWTFVSQITKQLKRPALALPNDLFLRILPPPAGAITIYQSRDDLSMLSEHPDILSGHVVIVGEGSKKDQFHTPFGILPGAQIHAYAIYDLLNGYSIVRCPPILVALLIYASCFILALIARGLRPVRQLLIAAICMPGFVLLLAVAAMYFLNVWLDIMYPALAVWLLIPLLLVLRRRTRP